MDETWNVAFENGAQAIVDPNWNDGYDKVPMHAVTFWQMARGVVAAKEGWGKSVKWMERQRKMVIDKETTACLDTAFERLETLPWNGPLPWLSSSSRTKGFVRLLGDEWLDDENIDMMMEFLSDCVERANGAGEVKIAQLSFSRKLVQCDEGGNYNANAYGKECGRYEQLAKSTELKRLYFPVHVNGNHWIAVCIDFERKKICYGTYWY
jgi:hypothetical protein